MPLDWVEGAHPDAAQRGLKLAGHDLDGLPPDLGSAETFYEARRQKMAQKVPTLLGVQAAR